jgi:microcystin-dependent protein
MMNFLKDWIIQYQNKYSVGGVETTIDRITGTVSQEGDTISAAYLNEIQKNCIYQVNATRVIEGVLEIYDITIDGSEEFTPFNQTFLIDFSETNTQVDSLLRFNGITYSLRFINYNTDIVPAIGGIPKQALVILDVANSKAYIQSVPLEEKQIIGKIGYIAHSTVPTGYLKANGAAISRTTYASLFALIGTTYGVGDGFTTFNLPDLRGTFIRGLDEGRGLDSGRVLGSYQDDAFQGHKHNLIVFGSVLNNAPGTGLVAGYNAASGSVTNAYGITSPINDDTNGPARTGIETRPRNVALIPVIKY